MLMLLLVDISVVSVTASDAYNEKIHLVETANSIPENELEIAFFHLW